MFFYLLVAIKPGSRSKSEVNYRSLGEMCSLAVLRQGRRSKEGPRGWGGEGAIAPSDFGRIKGQLNSE